jgi:hypothetical protein
MEQARQALKKLNVFASMTPNIQEPIFPKARLDTRSAPIFGATMRGLFSMHAHGMRMIAIARYPALPG